MVAQSPTARRRRLTLAVASALALVSLPAAPSMVVGEAAAQTRSRTLPLVVIRAPSGIVDEPKRRATMRVIDRTRRGSRRTNYAGRIGIELRGFTSLGEPKKSYALELRTRSGKNRNVSLLGMPKDEDWVLSAGYRDKSLLRNVVAYSAARWLGRYAPRTRPVEVVVNGRYRGVYVLTEQLKVHKRRVAADDRRISGGYLLEMINLGRIRGERFFRTPVEKEIIIYSDPSGEDLSRRRADWIRGYVERFERVLYGPAFSDPLRGYHRYLDMGAAVDFVLLNELFKNWDTFRVSTYMHKGVGGKLVLGPLWDFDHALGNFPAQGDRVDNVAGWLFAEEPWAGRLYLDPAFRARLVRRWRSIRARGLLRHIMRTIDRGARQLGAARARNFRRWRILGVDLQSPIDPRTGAIPQTYAQELDYLKSWLTRRTRWIDSQIR